MDEQFGKIKTKYLKGAIIISAVAAVCFGLLSTGAVLLGLKLSAIRIGAWCYVLIGLGSAAIVGVPLFFILRPTDRRLAKRLDKIYALDERIQTMVGYSDSEGELVRRQRDDASERLKSLKPKKPAIHFIVVALLVPILACGVFLSGMMIKNRATTEENEAPPFVPTEHTQNELTQLIRNVESSALEDGVKAPIILILSDLMVTMEEFDDVVTMSAQVRSAIEGINTVIRNTNTYSTVAGVLLVCEYYDGYGAAIERAAGSYTEKGAVSAFEEVTERSETLYEEFDTAFENAFEEIAAAIADDVRVYGSTETFIASFATAYEAIAALGLNDSLFKALTEYSDRMTALDRQMSGSSRPSEQSIRARVTNSYQFLVDDTKDALWHQSYNMMMGDYIRAELYSIFSLSPLPSEGGPSGGNQNGGVDDPDDTNNNGGYGDKDHIYGTDAEVYDPNTNEYVEMNLEFILRYERASNATIGELPEDIQRFIREYYQMLTSGISDNEENN